MVASVAPPAIHSVDTFDIIATISTNITVSAVLKICSIVCDLAVAFKFCLPLKYPLITDDIATKNIAGDNATKVISASGICNQSFAITFAPKNNIKLPTNPITANVANAILKILCAPLWSPKSYSF